MEMVVEEVGGGIAAVLFRGRLDSAGAAEVEQRFREVTATRRAIVVDLSEVSYMASLGVQMLVVAAKAVGRNGGKIAIAAPSRTVAAVLGSAGIGALVPIFAARDEAIANVGS